MRTAHSAQIWWIFLPVYYRPSKMPGFLIWFYAILGRIVVPELRFPGISVGKFFLDHVALEIAVMYNQKYFTLVEIDVSFDSVENMFLVNLLASQIRKIFAALFEDPWDFPHLKPLVAHQ